MKKAIIIVLVIIVSLVAYCTKNDETQNVLKEESQQKGNDSKMLSIELSDQEEEDLIFLREEEKLARDVYLFSFDKYQKQIFNNISLSEQQHMDKVLVLLDKYQIADPIIDEIGEFLNPILQDLYDELIELSNSSLNNALIAGATIEDLDIHDIYTYEGNTSRLDLLSVYGNLKCGSRNHLRSYYEQLEKTSTVYIPQFISVDEFNDIVTTSKEKCGND